jgi:outer membrane autotransporter protein
MALVNWVYYKADDYIETGAGSADLNVSTKALQQVDLGLGGKLAWNLWNTGGAHVVPEIHGNYRREMIGDRLETLSNFTGGGPAFSGESPVPARNKFNLGAQFKYATVDNVELTASYDFDTKQDFTSHAGMLRVGYKF